MPPMDEAGRPREPDCLDSNPATWHLAVNQLGVAKRGFIMDATYTSEVWNHPVTAYRYEYFNPKTDLPAASLKNAIVELARFPEDHYSRSRGAASRFVIGIEMQVT
jgi:hypothetical protein